MPQHINVSGTWKQITSLLASLLGTPLNGVHVTIQPTDANCVMQLLNTGGWSLTGGGSGTWQSGGSASDYEARWTTTSGTLSGGTAGSWLGLGTSRSWSRNRTDNTAGTNTCVGTLEIRMAASPNTVLSTSTVTLEATVEV